MWEKGFPRSLRRKLVDSNRCPNCGALQEICNECGITGNHPNVGWEGHLSRIEIGWYLIEAFIDNEGKRISPKDAPEVR